MYGSTGDQDGLLAAMGVPSELWESMRDSSGVAIWKEHADSFSVFSAMATQWRISMGGPTGLDYSALPGVMHLVGVRKKHQAAVFENVRVMESAALAVMAEQRKG